MQNVLGESVAADVVVVSKGRKNLQQIIANYALQNAYSVYETGLFYCWSQMQHLLQVR